MADYIRAHIVQGVGPMGDAEDLSAHMTALLGGGAEADVSEYAHRKL